MKNTLTKKQVLASFAEIWADIVRYNPRAKGDSIMKSEEFNNHIDMLCQDKQITQRQISNWSNPF